MYIVEITYLKDFSEIEKALEAHRSYLDIFFAKGQFIVSGPKIPRDGGIIVVQDMPRDELLDIIKNDPYSIEKLASYKITEFTAVKKIDRLK